MTDWNAAKPLLDAKLDPSTVRKPSGSFGPKGDYIEGWHAIAEANRIFGHGGWSYTITSLSKDALDKADKNGKPQWQAAYTCVVRVQVGDVVREDVGFGSGFAAQVGDAIEGATKEAVTDALKRALRTFGWPFGLALYDKSRDHVGVAEKPATERDPVALADALIAKINAAPDQGAVDTVLSKNAKLREWLAGADAGQHAFVEAAIAARRATLAHERAA